MQAQSRIWNVLAWKTSSNSCAIEKPTWTKLYSKVPAAARYGLCAAVRCSTMFIVGGLCSDGSPPSNEIMRYEISARFWMQPLPLGIEKCQELTRNSVTYAGMTFAASTWNIFR